MRGNSFESHFQSGRIAGLRPHDESPKPWGIQTDIVAVGGSSGSPILDPSSREVIGMAQQVIATTVVWRSPNGISLRSYQSDIITVPEYFEGLF